MQFITSPNKILGLDISELSLKAVQIKKSRGKKFIQAMNSIKLPAGLIDEGVIKDHPKVAGLIKKLIGGAQNKFSTKYCGVCLPEPKTFIKVVEIPYKETQKQKVQEIIMAELPRHMPVSMEEAQIDWQEVGNDHKQRKFLVGAVDRQIADDYVRVCEMAGLKVAALEVEAQAIVKSITAERGGGKHRTNWIDKLKKKEMVSEVKADDSPKIILDLGATRTGLILMDHRVIQFANSLANISGEKITNRIMEEKKLSYGQAEKTKVLCGINPKKCRGAVMTIINEAIENLLKEIIDADNFYQTHFGQETHSIEIILSGGGAHLSGIDSVLAEKTKRKVSVANPLINLEETLPKKVANVSAYTTAIGLALRNL